MRQGWYISIAAHLALLLVVLFGGLFARDRIPEVSVSEVTWLGGVMSRCCLRSAMYAHQNSCLSSVKYGQWTE